MWKSIVGAPLTPHRAALRVTRARARARRGAEAMQAAFAHPP